MVEITLDRLIAVCKDCQTVDKKKELNLIYMREELNDSRAQGSCRKIEKMEGNE